MSRGRCGRYWRPRPIDTSRMPLAGALRAADAELLLQALLVPYLRLPLLLRFFAEPSRTVALGAAPRPQPPPQPPP